MTRTAAEFIHEANIDHFTRKLAAELDPAQRKLISELLEAEIKKLGAAQKREQI